MKIHRLLMEISLEGENLDIVNVNVMESMEFVDRGDGYRTGE